MSDPKKHPAAPPPDDFSKTTPNINLPQDDSPVDWDKTNYNYPKQPSSEEWGKTVANIKPIDTSVSGQNFPGARAPSTPEWGVTEANIDMSQADFGSRPEDFTGNRSDEGYGKTTPYFSLPEAERAKYQNLPPAPTETAAKQAEEKKGGVPGWLWAAAGLLMMFFFAVVVLGVVFFFILRDSGFKATVVGAPVGSEVRVDDVPLGTTTGEDGTIELLNLKAGPRKISILHPNFTCEPQTIVGGNGVNPDSIRAKCSPSKLRAGEDCSNIQLGEEDKAERCYNAALDALPDPFSVEDLVKALNILIVNFKSGSYEIPPFRLEALKKGAGYIQRLPSHVVLEVGGHTDNVGGSESNQKLSENRANAVKSKLETFGVRPGSLQIRGYGSNNPRTDNNTELSRFYNRRIQYSIVKK
ncbi:MAG: OmpA family protein [Pyrinomonadaceae bacterium]